MKRLYVALCFLVIAISLCIFEQYTVNKTYKDVTAYINTAIEYTQKEDYSNAGATCKKINDYWNDKQKCMTAMIDHSSLDEAGVTINNLEELAEEESDSLTQELITAKSQIKSIYDNQRITFGNVF